MRKISELLELLKKAYKININPKVSGDAPVCLSVAVAYLGCWSSPRVTPKENIELDRYLRSNRPKDSGDDVFWYNFNDDEVKATRTKEYIDKRYAWLDKHIKLNKEKENVTQEI